MIESYPKDYEDMLDNSLLVCRFENKDKDYKNVNCNNSKAMNKLILEEINRKNEQIEKKFWNSCLKTTDNTSEGDLNVGSRIVFTMNKGLYNILNIVHIHQKEIKKKLRI